MHEEQVALLSKLITSEKLLAALCGIRELGTGDWRNYQKGWTVKHSAMQRLQSSKRCFMYFANLQKINKHDEEKWNASKKHEE